MFVEGVKVIVVAKATTAWDSIEPEYENKIGVVVEDPFKSDLVRTNWVMVQFPEVEIPEGFYPEELSLYGN